MRPLSLAALLLLASTGCSNACYNLAKSICQCQPTATAISTCNANVSQASSVSNPSAADLAACSAALNTCDCRSLASGSYASKVNCLLARPNPADRSLNP